VLLEQEPRQKVRSHVAEDGLNPVVSITAYTANRVELAVTTSEPGFLVMSDSYSPYWQARDNEVPVEVMRANGIMRAIPLPAGKHRLVMQYRPWPVIIGMAISACGWLALICMIAYHLLSVRRKSTLGRPEKETT